MKLGQIRQRFVKSFGVIVNPVTCLYPGNRPIPERLAFTSDRFSGNTGLLESPDNLPTKAHNLPTSYRPITTS